MASDGDRGRNARVEMIKMVRKRSRQALMKTTEKREEESGQEGEALQEKMEEVNLIKKKKKNS